MIDQNEELLAGIQLVYDWIVPPAAATQSSPVVTFVSPETVLEVVPVRIVGY